MFTFKLSVATRRILFVEAKSPSAFSSMNRSSMCIVSISVRTFGNVFELLKLSKCVNSAIQLCIGVCSAHKATSLLSECRETSPW